MKTPLWRALAMAGLTILGTAGVHAATLVQGMGVPELADRADKVFRGTVLGVTQGTVEAGGAELPTVTYRLKVTEEFKGSFIAKGDDHFAEITMIGEFKSAPAGEMRHLSPAPDVPRLEIGKQYLLMTTPPSAIGLSAPVGLAQGCWTVSGEGKSAMAQNAVGIRLAYDELARQIRAAVRR